MVILKVSSVDASEPFSSSFGGLQQMALGTAFHFHLAAQQLLVVQLLWCCAVLEGQPFSGKKTNIKKILKTTKARFSKQTTFTKIKGIVFLFFPLSLSA